MEKRKEAGEEEKRVTFFSCDEQRAIFCAVVVRRLQKGDL